MLQISASDIFQLLNATSHFLLSKVLVVGEKELQFNSGTVVEISTGGNRCWLEFKCVVGVATGYWGGYWLLGWLLVIGVVTGYW